MTSAVPRHRWSEPDRSVYLRTSRTFLRCGLVKTTRHDGEPAALPWTEFYDGDALLDVGAVSGPTPPCDPKWGVAQ